MVIQREKPFEIWGWSDPLVRIIIKTDWLEANIVCEVDCQGIWKAIIHVPKVNQGEFSSHEIYISNNVDEILLNDILIGEVWIAAGQSNMCYYMKKDDGKSNGVINYEQEIAQAHYPDIRLFTAKHNFQMVPCDEIDGKWEKCTPQVIEHFSAVAYYFIRELYFCLNIPVGIIVCGLGGSTAEAWTSRRTLENDEDLYKMYLKPFDECLLSKEALNDDFSFEKARRPTLLYNGMIHPFKRLSIRGFVWYHGELNRGDNSNYLRLTKGMIEDWRFEFGQKGIPFYFVQQPPYFWDCDDTSRFDYAVFREYQEKLRELPNVEMAVIMDEKEILRLHPRNKKIVGIRLSKIALNRVYGLKYIQFLGPKVRKVKIIGRKIEISYKKNTVGVKLTTADGLPPKHFEIAEKNRIFYPSDATIKNSKILLESKFISAPVAVRYAFTNTAVTNLMNCAGLPAEPFRTDSWGKKKIITIANNKGGVGKSTLALNLYNYFESKEKLALIETDPEGCLFRLREFRSNFVILKERDISRILDLPYDLLIIDTPPISPLTLKDLFSASDFILIPTNIGLFDMLMINQIIEQVLDIQTRHTVKVGIVMNKVRKVSAVALEMQQHLKNLTPRLMDSVITDRASFNKSPLTYGVFNTGDKIAKRQIGLLAEEILAIIG